MGTRSGQCSERSRRDVPHLFSAQRDRGVDHVLSTRVVAQSLPGREHAIMNSKAFEYACEELERDGSLSGPQARGTVRLALKEAGFEPRKVQPSQLIAVFERLMKARLTAQGIGSDQANALCSKIVHGLSQIEETGGGDSAASMFDRLDRQ